MKNVLLRRLTKRFMITVKNLLFLLNISNFDRKKLLNNQEGKFEQKYQNSSSIVI